MGFAEDVGQALELSTSCITPAFEATKKLLFPFEMKNWLRIALVVFLSSYLINANLQLNMPDTLKINPITAISLVMLLLLLGAGGIVVSSLFKFVFLRVLLKDKRSLWEMSKENLGNGLQLLVLSAAMFIPVVVIGLLLIGGAIFLGQSSIILFFLLLLLAFVVMFPIIFIVAFVQQLTYQFVTLIMVTQKVGIVEGWKRLWRMITGHLTYWVIFFIISGVVGGIIGIIPAMVLMVPAFFIGMVMVIVMIGIGIILSMLPELVAQVLILVLVLLLIAIMLLLGFLGTALLLPIPVFMRYFTITFFDKFLGTFKPRKS